MAHRKKDHCKKHSSDDVYLPEEVLLVDESSQFVGENVQQSDSLVDVHMSGDNNLVHCAVETTDNHIEVLNDSSSATTQPEYNKTIKRTFLKEKVDNVSTATEVQPGYSLLLKSSNKDINDAVL